MKHTPLAQRRLAAKVARTVASTIEHPAMKARRLRDQAEHDRAMVRKLCGEFVSEEEMADYMRTGVCPARILKGHTWPQAEEVCPISGLPERIFSGPKQELNPWD